MDEARRQLSAEAEESRQRLLRRSVPAIYRRTDEEIHTSEQRAAEARAAGRVIDARRFCAVPARYAGASLDDLSHIPADAQGKYRSAAAALLRLVREPGIIALVGEIGSGKTHLACALVNEMVGAGRMARYISAKGYIDAVRETYSPNATRTIHQVEMEHVRAELLVLDELQVRGETDNEQMLLMRLIDMRYQSKRSTVLIANFQSRDEFMQKIDARIADRMHDGGGVFVCDWQSLRGRVGQKG